MEDVRGRDWLGWVFHLLQIFGKILPRAASEHGKWGVHLPIR